MAGDLQHGTVKMATIRLSRAMMTKLASDSGLPVRPWGSVEDARRDHCRRGA